MNDKRIITIAFFGGPLDGNTEELEVNGPLPYNINRRRPAPISFTAPEPDDLSAPTGIIEYQLRGGPGFVGRTGGGGWIYDYKGTR